MKGAVWGGLMSARAKAKKVQGVVIDGRVRDLREHRSMEYPVSIALSSQLKKGRGKMHNSRNDANNSNYEGYCML